jgi:hypothetical protein
MIRIVKDIRHDYQSSARLARDLRDGGIDLF